MPAEEDDLFPAMTFEEDGAPPADPPSDPPAEPTPPAADPAPGTEGEGGTTVPLAALKAIREEKKAIKDELEALKATIAPQAPPSPQPAPVPQAMPPLDPFNPQFGAQLQHIVAHQTTQTRLQISRDMAEREFGKEEVAAAYAYFDQNPDQSHGLLKESSPFHAAVTAYRRAKAMAEIGDDPAAYRAKLAEEIRAQVVAELQAQPPARQPNPSLANKANLTNPSPSQEWSGPTPLDEILGG